MRDLVAVLGFSQSVGVRPKTENKRAAQTGRKSLDPATKKRIEDAVLDIFSQSEFHKVSLIEVARGANVSLQTIYKYYGSKEVLLFACLDTWLQQAAHRMLDHLQGIETYKDRLRKVFWVVLDFFDKNPKVAQLIMSSVYITTWQQTDTFRQPNLFPVFMKVLHEGKDEGILDDAVDEKILLDFMIGITSRHIIMWISRGQKDALTKDANQIFEMIWRAIAK